MGVRFFLLLTKSFTSRYRSSKNSPDMQSGTWRQSSPLFPVGSILSSHHRQLGSYMFPKVAPATSTSSKRLKGCSSRTENFEGTEKALAACRRQVTKKEHNYYSLSEAENFSVFSTVLLFSNKCNISTRHPCANCV